MSEEINFKELYSVILKTTLPIEVGGKIIESGETIASFERIQIANFQEIKNVVTSNGGWDNRAHVIWETTKEIRISFTQGVFSKIQLALMSNAKLTKNEGKEEIILPKREILESDEAGRLELAETPLQEIFVYDSQTGEKIKNWTNSKNVLVLPYSYKTVIVDYSYKYSNGFTKVTIGQALTRGYLSLIGKTRVKDDDTGKVKTGIIKIPKLKLMSDLSMRVGSDAIPQIGRLDAIAVPEGARGQSKAMEIIFLNDDVDADI